MEKYGLQRNVATAYDEQTSWQVEVSNKDIKQLQAKTVKANRIEWSRKLDDSLWAYYTTYKTPSVCLRNNFYVGSPVTYCSI